MRITELFPSGFWQYAPGVSRSHASSFLKAIKRFKMSETKKRRRLSDEEDMEDSDFEALHLELSSAESSSDSERDSERDDATMESDLFNIQSFNNNKNKSKTKKKKQIVT